jgi:hypothetical protein
LNNLSSAYDITVLDKKREPDYEVTRSSYETIQSDITDYESIRPFFEDVDAVIHLAADPDVSAQFDSVLQNNILGTYNIIEAAENAGVDSFVFASSNHVIGMYEKEYAPELYTGEVDLLLTHTDPVRPDSLYATSKIFGESVCRYYVEKESTLKKCHSLRIFSVRPPKYDHPYGDAERGVHKGEWGRQSDEYERAVARLQATWLSRRDLGHLVDCSLNSEVQGFDIFYGVSDNDNKWVDISHARQEIGYEPADSADDYEVRPK